MTKTTKLIVSNKTFDVVHNDEKIVDVLHEGQSVLGKEVDLKVIDKFYYQLFNDTYEYGEMDVYDQFYFPELGKQNLKIKFLNNDEDENKKEMVCEKSALKEVAKVEIVKFSVHNDCLVVELFNADRAQVAYDGNIVFLGFNRKRTRKNFYSIEEMNKQKNIVYL